MRWRIRRIVNGCAAQQLVARRDVIAPEFISYGLLGALNLPSADDLTVASDFRVKNVKWISNRAVIIVRPKTPFVNWVRNADVEGKDVTEKDIGKEPNVYLVYDYEMDGDKDELIDENYKEIFEAELNAWITDQTLWPRKMDLKTFLDWFHVEFHGMVLDLSEEGHMIE